MPKMIDDDFNESEMFSEQALPVPRPVVAAPVGNPLSAYFRLPGLSVALPTDGAFFPEGGCDLDAAGEVSVLPMRAQDELLLASPDALMNNTAIVGLVRSCVPQIKMPELISVPDLDVLLIAIRVASSGETMELELTCPACSKPGTFEINLPAVLGTAQKIPPVNPLRLSDDIVIYMRPHTVAAQTKILVSAFRETRTAQAIDANPDLPQEVRDEQLNGVMTRLNDMNLYGLANSIVKVVIPGHEVTEIEYIKEFLGNTDKNTLNKLRDGLEALNNMGIDKTVPAVCAHCAHEWMGQIEFNPATFFEDRSSD